MITRSCRRTASLQLDYEVTSASMCTRTSAEYIQNVKMWIGRKADNWEHNSGKEEKENDSAIVYV